MSNAPSIPAQFDGNAPNHRPHHGKRVLLVSYPFPPVGGAGVQRVTKFVKYLPRHGWEVSVLTVANPSVPLFDNSLLQDIPPETIIRRGRSWEPGYAMKASVSGKEENSNKPKRWSLKKSITGMARSFGTFLLQPDPQILWLPGAIATGKRLLREIPHQAILVSGPPFSSFMIGASLSRFARIPLILDYRDEWTISNEYWENKRLGPLSKKVQWWMQSKVIRASSGLLATTRFSAEALKSLGAKAGKRLPVTWIYNGFDPDDFSHGSASSHISNDMFRLAYIGTLWNLTSVEPVVEAVKIVSQSHPDLAKKLELVFAGRRVGAQVDHLNRLQGLPCRLIEQPYIEHASAVELMQFSSALCLLLSDLPGAGRVVPAKLFEYMATGNPILSITPPGETWDLLQSYPGKATFVPSDRQGIADWLIRSIQKHAEGKFPHAVHWDASVYDRNNEARQLGEFLDSVSRQPKPNA